MNKAIGVGSLSNSEIESIKAQLTELEPFLNLQIEEIGRLSEPVFIRDHFCNENLKEGVTKPHPRSGYDMIIKD